MGNLSKELTNMENRLTTKLEATISSGPAEVDATLTVKP